MIKSILTKNQKKAFTKIIGNRVSITAKIRFDDDCGNGHNTFSITGEIKDHKIRGSDKIVCCGCIHDEIVLHFPEFAHLIKWHLVSTEGPMHYVANSLYHAEDNNLDFAQKSAVWPEATLKDFTKEKLEQRLPSLLVEFKSVIESLGFVY